MGAPAALATDDLEATAGAGPNQNRLKHAMACQDRIGEGLDRGECFRTLEIGARLIGVAVDQGGRYIYACGRRAHTAQISGHNVLCKRKVVMVAKGKKEGSGEVILAEPVEEPEQRNVGGRPRIPVSPESVYQLSRIMATVEEMAHALGID